MKKTSGSLGLILRDLRFVAGMAPGVLPLVVLEGVFEGLLPFIGIYLSALVINGIAAGLPLATLLVYAAAALGLTLAVSVLKAMAKQAKDVGWRKMLYQRDLKIAVKMSQVDYGGLEDPETHRLYRSLWEVENLESGFYKIGNVFLPTIQGLSAMIIAASLSWRVFAGGAYAGPSGFLRFVCSPLCSLLVLLCVAASVALNIWSSKGVLRATRFFLDKTRSFNNRLLYYTQTYVQGYTAGKDIRIYGQKELINREMDGLIRQKYRDNDHYGTQYTLYQGASTLASGILNLVAYLFVAVKSLAGLFAVGDIVRYVGGIIQFTGGLATFLNGYTHLKANTQFMEIYYKFFDLPNALHTGASPIPAQETHSIEFRGVSFRYPGAGEYALKDFSCTLQTGKRHAIVGMNGSGKTTLVKLLCRLYDPQEGAILLDGRDIREYDYERYLALFSVVFQDFKLFPFSIGQNVAAAMEYDADRARAALEKAGFGPRLRELEQGCETIIYKDFDQDGVEISGGEAQKIAIARAIYKDAPFVVLDEPTAALDPLAEQEIYLKFDAISAGKTTVYISHRLSSCKFCDEILVMDKGQLVQRGSHQTLAAQPDGKYYELWHAQARHYTT
jgi:ATP-binding cassette subfamily B protein